MRRSLMLVLPVLAPLGACVAGGSGPNAGSASPRTETITVSVGPCFGFCPVYDVVVTPAGAVRFSGRRHTALLGDRDRNAGVAAYRSVARDLAAFRPADGTTTAVQCSAAISDTSPYTVTWTGADGRRTVATHQRGCIDGPGKALDGVLATLPARLGIEDWAKQTTRPGSGRG